MHLANTLRSHMSDDLAHFVHDAGKSAQALNMKLYHLNAHRNKIYHSHENNSLNIYLYYNYMAWCLG